MFHRTYNKSISDYYRELSEKVRSEILRESDTQILGSDLEELSKYYLEKCQLSPILIDETKDANWEHESYVRRIAAHEREEFYQNEGNIDWQCERVKVEIPIKINNNIEIISQLNSSTFSVSFSAREFNWSPEKITFSIETKGYGFTYDEDKIVQEINSKIEKIKKLIEWKSNNIESENQNLFEQIKRIIETRKQEIQKNKEKIQSLTQKINIPLKKNVSVGAQRIMIDSKPIVQRIKPDPKLPEEYILDEQKVLDILDVLDNQAKSFEKTPGSLVSLGEENLRDLLLANLNSIFEGKATGETFSKKGKTDIYLNINKGNILVFECKKWGGEKIFLDTMDQLRGYLTWRHNYGVIIIFAKVKNFSNILSQIPEIIQKSSSFRNGYKKNNETHFSAVHNLDDEDKEIKVHYLIYNLYTEK